MFDYMLSISITLKRFIAETILRRHKSVPPLSEAEVAAEVERNYRWNFTVNLLDGVTFWFGISFASVSTIVPLFISKLTMNPLVIGLIAMIAQGGWYLPQLLTAGHTERLPWKKPIVINAGFFLERFPVWLWPVAALLAPRYPTFALILFLLGFAWHTLGAGVIAPAWQDLIARCFQVTRRGRFFGLTAFLGTGAGALGSLASSWILKTYPFPLSFVLTFLVTAVFINLSWAFLALTRETVQPTTDAPPPVHVPFWRRFWEIVRQDHNFRRFLRARFLTTLGMMAQGFVAVAAIWRWQVPDSTVALYTGALLIGQAIGNLGAGLLADRAGYKLTLELGVCANTAAFFLAWLAPSPLWFYGVFALLGMAIGARIVSGVMISMEFSPAAQRPTYIGISNTVAGIGGGLAPLLGGWIANYSYGWLFFLSSAVGLSSFVLLHWFVKEPRHQKIKN
jgi:MFS family permease